MAEDAGDKPGIDRGLSVRQAGFEILTTIKDPEHRQGVAHPHVRDDHPSTIGQGPKPRPDVVARPPPVRKIRQGATGINDIPDESPGHVWGRCFGHISE